MNKTIDMSKIIIFGNSEMSDMANYYFNTDTEHEVVAYTVEKEYVKTKQHNGLPLIEFENIDEKYPPENYKMFIALGYTNTNKFKKEIYNKVRKKSYDFISYINSKACIADNAVIGDNCFILEKAIVQPFVKIGNNVTLWSACQIAHHTIIDDHCFIAPSASVAGKVSIGECCFIGNNSTIRDNVKIGKNSIIGAGTVILEDVPQNSVFKAKTDNKLNVNSDDVKNI